MISGPIFLILALVGSVRGLLNFNHTTTISTTLTRGRFGHMPFYHQGKAYIHGGRDSSGNTWADIHYFDDTLGDWVEQISHNAAKDKLGEMSFGSIISMKSDMIYRDRGLDAGEWNSPKAPPSCRYDRGKSFKMGADIITMVKESTDRRACSFGHSIGRFLDANALMIGGGFLTSTGEIAFVKSGDRLTFADLLDKGVYVNRNALVGASPPARLFASQVSLALSVLPASEKEDVTVLYGGIDRSGDILNDMWVGKMYTDAEGKFVREWGEISIGLQRGELPESGRYGHAAASVGHHMYVYGGYTTTKDLLLAFNVMTYSWTQYASVVPRQRLMFHSMQAFSQAARCPGLVISGGVLSNLEQKPLGASTLFGLQTEATRDITTVRPIASIVRIRGCLDTGAVTANCVFGQTVTITAVGVFPTTATTAVEVYVGSADPANECLRMTSFKQASIAGFDGVTTWACKLPANDAKFPAGRTWYPMVLVYCDQTSDFTISVSFLAFKITTGSIRVGGSITSELTSTLGDDILSVNGTFPTEGLLTMVLGDLVGGPVKPERSFACEVTARSKTSLSCTTAPGYGSKLYLRITINAQMIQTADTLTFPHPILADGTLRFDSDAEAPGDGLLTAPSSNGNDKLVVTARHLFPEQTEVFFTSKAVILGQARDSWIKLAVSTSETSSTLITFFSKAGAGGPFFIVVCVGKVNSLCSASTKISRFSYPANSPVLLSVAGCVSANVIVGSVTHSVATQCPSFGGTLITLRGERLVAPIQVHIGYFQCVNVLHYNDSTLTCTVPAGTGHRLDVTVISGGLSTAPLQGGLSYASPSIATIISTSDDLDDSGCTQEGNNLHSCPRSGLTRLTITGTDFGDRDASVIIGDLPCLSVAHHDRRPHEELTCMLPIGAGTSKRVSVLQQNGLLGLSGPNITVSYKECPLGHFDYLTECVPCARGTFAPQTAVESCMPCYPGTYAAEEGATSCDSCMPGTFQGNSGAVSCTQCPPGKSQSYSRQSQCEACRAGTATADKGTISCRECAVGTYQPASEATACLLCENGQYSEQEGMAACKECPDDRWLHTRTSNSTDGTVTTTYLCEPCDSLGHGATCKGGIVHANQNYFVVVLNDEMQLFPCLADSCTGCPETESLKGSYCNGCGINRAGTFPFDDNPLCGACMVGHTEINGACIPCDAVQWGVIGLLIGVAWFYVIIFYCISSRSSGHTKIFLFFVQTVLIVLQPFPQVWTSVLSLLNFNLLVGAGSTCIAPFTPIQTFQVALLAPLVCFAELAITFSLHLLIWAVFLKCRDDRLKVNLKRLRASSAFNWAEDSSRNLERDAAEKAVTDLEDQRLKFKRSPYVRTFFGLLLFMYSNITNTILRYLNCIDVGEHTVVLTSPGLSCTSPEYLSFYPVTITVGVVMILGVPVTLLAWLIRHRDELHDVAKNAKFNQRYAIIYETYRPECFWWESYSLLRRTFLVAVGVWFSDPDSAGLMMSALSMSLVAMLLVQVIGMPFKLALDNRFEAASLTILACICMPLASAPNLSHTGAMAVGLAIFIPTGAFAMYIAFVAMRNARIMILARFGRDPCAWCPLPRLAAVPRNSMDGTSIEMKENNLAPAYAP